MRTPSASPNLASLGIMAAAGCYSPSFDVESTQRAGTGGGGRLERGGAGAEVGVAGATPGSPTARDERSNAGGVRSPGAGGELGGAAGVPASTGFEITTGALPDGCVHDPFYTRLEAANGGGNYLWQVEVRDELDQRAALPEGIALDVDTGELEGTPGAGAAGTYRLQVLVTGGSNERTTRTLSWRVRASCKFAFMGTADGSQRLLVADARESQAEQVPRDLMSGAEAGAQVTSFELAPDGERIAFAATRDSTSSLHLARVFTEAPLVRVELGASPGADPELLEYEWSPDSERLAAISAAPGAPRVLALYDREGRSLGSVGAGEHVSALFWVGDRVCYHGTAVGGFDGVHCRSTVSGALPEGAETYYRELPYVFEGARYLSGEGGFALIAQDLPGFSERQVSYQAVPGALAAAHGIATLSPDLSWVAKTDSEDPGTMRLYSVADADIPAGSIPACEAVLAWSSDGRYLACRNGASTRLAELTEEGVLVRSADIEGLTHGGLAWRQLFTEPTTASSRRWYVSDTPERDLGIVDLSQPVWRLARVRAAKPPALPRLGLALRPGTHEVIYHAETSLYRIDLDQATAAPLAALAVPAPSIACLSDFTLSGPGFWCGSTDGFDILSVSPDGTSIALQAEDGLIYSIDLLGSGAPRASGSFYVACTEGEPGCADQLVFVR